MDRSDRTDEMGRRTFLRAAGVTGAAAAGAASVGLGTPAQAAGTAATPVFAAGVSAGDPEADRSLIWTRVTPDGTGAPVPIDWEVAADGAFVDVVASGSASAEAASDFTVKVPVEGLSSDTKYAYRFRARGSESTHGVLRTAPSPGANKASVRFAIATCQSYWMGYYTAYRAMAQEDVDFLVHLGDFIYADTGWAVGPRRDPVRDAWTLDQYRGKYKLYRSDADLQAAMAAMPLVAIWDDHEIQNNYNRLVDPGRKAAAYQAWSEYMPTEFQGDDPADPNRIYRRLAWGDLMECHLLDGRQYRDPQASTGNTSVYPAKRLADADRTLLGAMQKTWLKDGLVASSATWQVIAQDVMMMYYRWLDLDEPWLRRLNPNLTPNAGVYTHDDTWDGYQGERRELVTLVDESGLDNVVVLTGDDHSFWAGQVRRDYDDPASHPVLSEFVCGAITSWTDLDYALFGFNPRWDPEVMYVNHKTKGYAVVEITPEELTCEFKGTDVSNPASGAWSLAKFRVPAGTRALERIS